MSSKNKKKNKKKKKKGAKKAPQSNTNPNPAPPTIAESDSDSSDSLPPLEPVPQKASSSSSHQHGPGCSHSHSHGKKEVTHSSISDQPPSAHKPWSALIWPPEKREQYFKESTTGHGLPYVPFKDEGNCKAIIHIFKNDGKDNFPSKFEIRSPLNQPAIQFWMNVSRKMGPPVCYFLLYLVGQDEPIRSSDSCRTLFKKDGGSIELWAVQFADRFEYSTKLPKPPKVNEPQPQVQIIGDPKTHALKIFDMSENNLLNASQVTTAQWEAYLTVRSNLQDKMFALMKEDSEAKDLVTETKTELVRLLSHSKKEPSSEDVQKYKAFSQCLYFWKVAIARDDESIEDSLVIGRYYSPFIVGNYVDFWVESQETVGYSDSGSQGAVYYVAGSFASTQSFSRIEAYGGEKLSKKKYICRSLLDSHREYEHRYLISTKELNQLQRHLFGTKCKLSPNRFFRFIFAASGADHVDSGARAFMGIQRCVKRSFERDAESEGDDDEKWKRLGAEEIKEDVDLFEVESNISLDEEDRDPDDDDDDEEGEIYDDFDDDDGDDDDDILQMDPELLQMLMREMGAQRGGGNGRGRGRGGRGRGGGEQQCPTQ